MPQARKKDPRRFGIRAKMLLAFGFILPLLIFAFGAFIQGWMFRYTTDLVIDTRLKTDISVAGEILTLKTRNEGTSDQVLLSPVLLQSLSQPAPSTALERYFLYRETQAVLAGISSSNDVLGIYVQGENNVYFRSEDTLANLARSMPETYNLLHEKAADAAGKNTWIATTDSLFSIVPRVIQPNPCLYVIRQMKPLTRKHSPIGTSIVEINPVRYVQALQRAVQFDGEYACVLDENGKIIMHSSNPNMLNQPFPSELMQYVIPNETGHVFTANRKAILIFLPIHRSAWAMVHYIPVAQINASLVPIGIFIWLAMLLSFVLLAVVLIAYSSSFVNPITRLASAMKHFGQGDIRLRLPSTRRDEIGDLENQFNDMAEDISNHMHENEAAAQARTQLELKVLENQINPHFLYNTLDLINWRSRMAGQPEIAEMSSLLAQFFRIGLHEGREYITVEQEIEHAKIYLEICKFRFDGLFKYEFNIPEALMGCRIKKLVLQPVLENAVKHGIRGAHSQALIRVTAEQSENDLLFHVYNNGHAITLQRLAEIRTLLSQPGITSGDAFGMQNIHRRIVLAYGEGYGLTMHSALGEGTHVFLRLGAKPPT